MVLALGIVVAVGFGAWALARPHASTTPTATPDAKPISTEPPPSGTAPPGVALQGGGSKEALGYVTTALGVVGAGVGIVKGVAGVGGATAGTSGATAAGASLSTVAGWAVAFVAVVGAAVVGIFQLVSDLDRLRHGPPGYVAELVQFCFKTADGFTERLRKPVAEGGWGMPELKARALARLLAWDATVAFNRAAWAYLKYGAGRENVFGVGVSVLGLTPELRHENTWIARGYALPDEIGLMYEPKVPPPPKPPGWPDGKRWPPLPAVMGDLQWTQTPEFFCFQGVNTTRAQCLQDAGGAYTEELRQMADFVGRAARCSYALHNKLGPGGQGIAVLDTADTVLFYVNCGMIGGLQPPPHLGSAHPKDTGRICFDNRTGNPCVHDFNLNLGWFFNESITDVPIRPYR